MKNLLKKSTDPYIALFNYRTTPFLHGYSPAELMMNRKLRNCVSTIPSQHIPFKPEVVEFKKKDEHFRNQQKYYHDLRHRAKEVPQLAKEQPVWVKTPATKEAMVIENASPRSVLQTDRGTQRRNRNQLHRRSENQTSAQTTMPKVSSTLPKQKLETRDETRYEEPAEERATTTVHQPAMGPGNPPPDNMPVEQTGRKIVYTKSGRTVHAPQGLDL